MDFHPDKLAKTVRIPVKVVNQQLAYFYETPKPKLREGAIGEVVLPEWAVLNQEALLLWQNEIEVPIFDADTLLFLGMQRNRVPLELCDEIIEPPLLSEARKFLLVPVRLKESLILILRGTKQATLRGGECQILSMEVDANSINHAYTLASTRYEPDRMSHTGNVFTRCFYKEEEEYLPLNILRNHHQATYEADKLLTPEMKKHHQE